MHCRQNICLNQYYVTFKWNIFFQKYHFICHVCFTFGPCNTVTILRNGSIQIKKNHKEYCKLFITFLHVLHCCNLPNRAIVSSVSKPTEGSVWWLNISFSSIDCFSLIPKKPSLLWNHHNSKKNNVSKFYLAPKSTNFHSHEYFWYIISNSNTNQPNCIFI